MQFNIDSESDNHADKQESISQKFTSFNFLNNPKMK